jgi:DNA-binding NarL/FixJ family response regulator
VRVLEVTGKAVVVDANHPRAGQRLDLEVQLVAFCEPGAPPLGPGRAIAFDVDAVSLASLRDALPGWEVVAVHGTSAASLSRGAPGGPADLLIVGARANATETLGLCRLLGARTAPPAGAPEEADEAHGPPAGAPLLVLVPREQQTLVGAALEAGARSCLLLPIHPKEVANMLANARAGDRPGRHTRGLDRAEATDPWQEDGGES